MPHAAATRTRPGGCATSTAPPPGRSNQNRISDITPAASHNERGTNGGQVTILDRLLHHSQVVTIRGDSCRLRGKRRSGLLQKAAAAQSGSETE